MADTGEKYPNGSQAGTGTQWGTPSNAYADDTSFSTTPVSTTRSDTGTTFWYGFDFSAIPDGATITQIDVDALYKINALPTGRTIGVQLYTGTGTTYGTEATHTATQIVAANTEYTVTQTLTTGLPTVAQLKAGGASGINVRVRHAVGNVTTSRQWSLDYVRILVTYTTTTQVGASRSFSYSIFKPTDNTKWLFTSDIHMVATDATETTNGETHPTELKDFSRYVMVNVAPYGWVNTGDERESQDTGTTEYANEEAGVALLPALTPGGTGTINATKPALPGNHDEDHPATWPSLDYTTWNSTHWGSPYHWTVDWPTASLRFIGIHTYVDHTDGTLMGCIDQSEITWLDNELANLPVGYSAVICSHIPLTTAFSQYVQGGTHEAHAHGDELRTMLQNYKWRIAWCMAGHLHHDNDHTTQGDIHHIAGAALSYTTNQAEYGGFNIVTYDAGNDNFTIQEYCGPGSGSTYASYGSAIVLSRPTEPTPGSWTYVGEGTVSKSGTGGNRTPGLPASLADGDLMVCVFSSGSTTGGAATMPAGWTNFFNSVADGITGSRQLQAWWKVASSESAPTVTWAGTAGCQAAICAFRNPAASPYDTKSSLVADATGSGTFPTVTTATDHELVLEIIMASAGAGAGSYTINTDGHTDPTGTAITQTTQTSNVMTVRYGEDAVAGSCAGDTWSETTVQTYIYGTVAFKVLAATQVGASRTFSYRLLGTAAASRSLLYRIINHLGQSRTLSYRVHGTVGASRTQSWRIRSLVPAVRSFSYRVINHLGLSRTFSYKVRNNVGSSRSVSYKLRNLAASARSLSWRIRSLPVAASRSFSYRIKGLAGLSRSLSYRIRSGVVGASRTASWRIHGIVGQSRTFSYAILATVGKAAKSLTFSYRVINHLGASRTMSWRVINHIGTSRTFSYRLKGLAGAQRAFSYRLRNLVTASRAFSYRVRALAGSSRSLSYRVKNLVGQSRTFSYAILQTVGVVGRQLAFSYRIINHVAASRTLSYRIRAAAVGQARSFSYRIVNHIGQARAFSYRVRSLAASSRAFSYRVRTLAARARTASWRILSLAGQTRDFSYRLRSTVFETLLVSWRVVNHVGTSRSLGWRVNGVVGAARSASWRIRALVGNSRSFSYRMLALAGRALSIRYVLGLAFPNANFTAALRDSHWSAVLRPRHWVAAVQKSHWFGEVKK